MVNRFFIIFLVICFSLLSVQAFAVVSYSLDSDITSGDKKFTLSDNVVSISMTKPAKPMKPFDIMLKFEKPNVSKVYLATNMVAMNMGRFLQVMQPNRNNTMSASMTLPKCGSGNTLWYSKLDVVYNSGNVETIYFFFDLK